MGKTTFADIQGRLGALSDDLHFLATGGYNILTDEQFDHPSNWAKVFECFKRLQSEFSDRFGLLSLYRKKLITTGIDRLARHIQKVSKKSAEQWNGKFLAVGSTIWDLRDGTLSELCEEKAPIVQVAQRWFDNLVDLMAPENEDYKTDSERIEQIVLFVDTVFIPWCRKRNGYLFSTFRRLMYVRFPFDASARLNAELSVRRTIWPH